MIARRWHGRVRLGDGDRYYRYLESTGLADYGNTPGNRGTIVLRDDRDVATHFTLITFWDSIEAIKRFAGDDYERARYYPADDEFLLEREPGVRHFHVPYAAMRRPLWPVA